MDHRVELESFFGDRRSGGVLLRFVLDMETGATCPTRVGGQTGIPYEVDLASRLVLVAASCFVALKLGKIWNEHRLPTLAAHFR
jgi:hypothetical protein